MGVVVYPGLAELLAEHQLTIEELERRIVERFSITVDSADLFRLTDTTPLRQIDLEPAGATAAVLGVGLDDLFYRGCAPWSG